MPAHPSRKARDDPTEGALARSVPYVLTRRRAQRSWRGRSSVWRLITQRGWTPLGAHEGAGRSSFPFRLSRDMERQTLVHPVRPLQPMGAGGRRPTVDQPVGVVVASRRDAAGRSFHG